MTVSVATESMLERNLGALGDANSDLLDRLRAAPRSAEIEFVETTDSLLSAVYRGRRLASVHRPQVEANALADRTDIIEHAVVVALGFGLGHHIAAIAGRMRKTGVIVVFEPDLSLLRAVFDKIDHSEWLKDSLVVFATDPNDRGTLAGMLRGAEAIIAQGVTFAEHPANRTRVGQAGVQFSNLFAEFVTNCKTTLLTTLVRSAETIRNMLWNVDHYARCAGIDDLKDVASGFPAVIVSAGPSLQRNIDLLAQPQVRDRCIIIGVQTTLKPLLAAGVRPHFVTALDYHAISKRFYDGLTESDVAGITLIAEPKAHPVILDSFPGAVRCVGAPFLDQLLGSATSSRMSLASGATVAHLAFYLAQHLGCDPIAFIGQDLGFTDGLYYAPGNAIHEVWAPELNPFNTIEMMEWQRIVRHRVHLHKMEDNAGKSIYTDSQMLAYLQQFERDFAEATRNGATVIDATEGGVQKRHTTLMPLQRVLTQYVVNPLPDLPDAFNNNDESNQQRASDRLTDVRKRVLHLEDLSRETASHLQRMLESQQNPRVMNELFAKVDHIREDVEKIFDTFELVNQFNQLAVFKRQRSDRKLELSSDLDPIIRQRAQIERDLINVTWTADAAHDFSDSLADAARILIEQPQEWTRPETHSTIDLDSKDESPQSHQSHVARTAILIPIDPNRLVAEAILKRTLSHVANAPEVDEIILIAPESLDCAWLEACEYSDSIVVERCAGSPFGPEFEAIAAARAFGRSCWRGALAGLSIWDEVLCPGPMLEVMDRRAIDAAVLCGADWPLVDISRETGIGALVRRWREHPDRHTLVFTQAPPGLSACVVSKTLMSELSCRNRLATVGGLLVYQPHAPQADPIAHDANVQIDHRVREPLIRATADECALELGPHESSQQDIVERIVAACEDGTPQLNHITIELTAQRSSCGLLAAAHASLPGSADSHTLPTDLIQWISNDPACSPGICITLGGRGDPLRHPDFDWIISEFKAAQAFVHVRTELRCNDETLDRLLSSGVDIVSADLHADRAATYSIMMGDDRFRDVLENIQYLIDHRRRLSDHPGSAAWALPWIVPRIMRCLATHEDIDSFFDRWQAILGTVVIDGPPPGFDAGLRATAPPQRVVYRELMSRMTIRADGRVPLLEYGECDTVGEIGDKSLSMVWQTLVQARRDLGIDCFRIVTP